MQNFLKNSQIKVSDYINSARDFLYYKFGVTDQTFSYSNPLGQLLLVIMNISRVIFFYIKDASNQTNFKTANRTHTVHGLAQLQGHNAQRGLPSRTVITLELKKEANLGLISGSIHIPNNLKIKCLNNDLPFLIKLNKSEERLNVNSLENIEFLAVQGEQRFMEFSSDGRNIQTYSIPALPNEMIADEFLFIESNGKRYNKYDSMRDSIFMDRFVMAKTGLTNGVDIIFGKSGSHTIPLNGELINVSYLMHKGLAGNVQTPMFKFTDSAVDDLGNNINLNDIFTIHSIDGSTYMGSSPEDIEITKAVAPNVVTNNIIHDERSYRYYIQKMNIFSNMKINKENRTLTAMLYPRLKDKITGVDDYFSMDLNSVLLTDVEKFRILEYLNDKTSNSIEIDIKNPKVVKFGINVIIEAFKMNGVREEDVVKNVRDSLSDYMINLKRLNKIPHSDIARILDSIDLIDTVNAQFIVESDSYIDELGNINLGEDTILMLRGGFFSHNGSFIEDSFDSTENSFVNIEIRWI